MRLRRKPRLDGRARSLPAWTGGGRLFVINGMIYMRGQAADYDGWRQAAIADWGWDDVLPYFLPSRRTILAWPDRAAWRGRRWRVRAPRLSWPDPRCCARCRGRDRYSKDRDDFNDGTMRARAISRSTSAAGVRWSAAEAFSARRLKRPNLHLQPARKPSASIRWQLRDRRALHPQTWRAVTAAAGRKSSWRQGLSTRRRSLELSGVGQANILIVSWYRASIVHELPGVGENLQDHLQISSHLRVDRRETLNRSSHDLLARAGMMGLEYATASVRALVMAPCSSACSPVASTDTPPPISNITSSRSSPTDSASPCTPIQP